MAEVNIMLGNFKILHVSGSSIIVVGRSHSENVRSYAKTNEGVGVIYGDNADNKMVADKSVINDPDYMDLPIMKETIKPPKYIKPFRNKPE
ncbi:MAG: hypothetical protein FH758_02040 [Firmicutes bacterium]|nr:hypothetical protein [Bacillota bacterium]